MEEVTYGRNSASLETYYDSLNEEQLAGIEAVSMDMSKSYISATSEKLPDGREKIVFDPAPAFRQKVGAGSESRSITGC